MFFRNYSIPGKGVKKRDPNQPRILTFFDILPRNIYRIFKINFLYLLLALPFILVTIFAMKLMYTQILSILAEQTTKNIADLFVLENESLSLIVLSFLFTVFLGQGPISAGLTFVVLEYGKEKHCWIVSDFLHNVKSNFKQAFILWILDLFVVCGGCFSLIFYISVKKYFFVVLTVNLLVVYCLMHIYIYQILITYKLKLRDILKNAVLIAIGRLPQSLLILIILVTTYVVLPIITIYFANKIVFLIMIIFEVLFFPAFSSFTVNFSIYPTIKKICG